MSIPKAIEFKTRTADPTETVPAGEVWLYTIGQSFFYKDDTQTINTFATGITREQVEDLLANSFEDTSSITWVYDDANNVFRAEVATSVLNDISNNASAITTNSTNISSNSSAISSNNTDISNLQAEQTTQNTNISNNAASASANATNISSNTSAISSNSSDISNLQTEQATQNTNIGNNASAISTIQSEQTTQDTNISNNASAIGTNSTNIGNNTTAIGSNSTAISGNSTDIANNTTAIGNNSTSIGNNSTAISGNTTSINNHVADTANPHGTNFSNLTDTTITTPLNGQIPVRRGASWVNEFPAQWRVINQAGHGFSLTNNVPLPAFMQTSGQVALAQADDLDTLGAFYITEILDANNFIIQQTGYVTATGHGLNIGRYYFLSNATAGAVTLVQPTVTIDDVCFFVIDANTIQLIDNRPVDKANIEKFLGKLVNNNNTTNLNTATFTAVPWDTGAPQINENGFYTFGTNSIIIPTTRSYEIKAHLYVFSTATRPNMRAQIFRNGSPIGSIAATAYIRNANGQNESSLHLNDDFSLVAGDIIDIRTQQEAAGGAVTFTSNGTSHFTVEAR